MPETRPATILTMDDAEILREAMAMYLESHGYRVLQAADGREGLALFAAEHPDLVLIDLRMPVMDGLEVLASLRESAPDVPAIVVSGTGLLQDALQAIRLGAWDFITKPLPDMAVLLHAVRKALERARLLAENARYQQGLEEEIRRRTKDLETAGRRLEEQNLFLKTLIESIPNPIFYKDAEGRLMGVNESFCRLVGRGRDELAGRRPEEVFPDDQTGLFGSIDLESLSPRAAFSHEAAFVDAAGQPRHLVVGKSAYPDAAGRPAGLVGVINDLTAHKRLEDRLRQSEARYRLLVDTLPTGIVELDKNGMFRFANPSFDAIFGYGPRQLLGTNICGLAADELGKNRIRNLLQPGEPGSPAKGICNIKSKTRDGRILDVRIDWSETTAVHDTGTAPAQRTGFIAAITDITDLERAKDVVQRSLDEKQVLLAEIHHRVKNNLQIILGFINIQAEEAASDGERDRFARLETRIRSMALIHQQLYKHGDLSTIDMAEYAQTLTQSLASIFRHTMATVAVTCDCQTFHLHLDKAVPCGLLLNECITNACKHAFLPGQPGQLTVRMRLTDGQATILVADSGRGLPPEFDLETTQSMGMTLIKELTRQLAGELHFATGPGLRVEVRFATA
ncbi:PAS domain S-box protein [Desulfovibrio sp. TomC]|uniref:PAS domain S-box protein n=1 Tax=Desulfovibrio sp. TomC TaxID=1562888 RepID=UPI00057379E4|nr:PAS domain S-box protein [Desulfovibrio sp. TomC]KHK03061.1 Serine phosphatase RsbU, regulator of sigma subunit [Desulfovibrio sp. TomC]